MKYVTNVRLRGQDGLYAIQISQGEISAILPMAELPHSDVEILLDAGERLVSAPFVEPHIHLDATGTAGEPSWNMSGTLFEGIERWSERKAMVTHEDVKQRTRRTLKMLTQYGVQAVRSHVDVTDPTLTALEALLDIKQEVAPWIELQLVAFPQEGILSYPNGVQLMEKAVEMGVDVVGGIPHFEFTRDYGVESVKILMNLAQKYDRLVDVHCDEIDDPGSRFLEVLAAEALKRDLGHRVTASHTTAMHSYDNAYCSRLFRLLKMSQINFVSCPTESIHLQGRFDNFPKRRGVTRVKELLEAGLNVGLGQDSIQDPWYSLGNGNLLRTLDFALHICHMMGYDDYRNALDLISHNSAKVLNIQDRYGVEVGKPANFILLDGPDDYEVLRRQSAVTASIRAGDIIMQQTPAVVTQNIQL
ncbi:cytosine deaminase [Hahella aquimaris]|uniref:cytosine deaminase n=1 Tax=Hahella sp. HNIBRBA332 TaxID=3015983 RepID=UPI00273C89C5|nr:cytosine deaminase [Hahella sp. HNIBRBA332]WLQ14740.1 cytosine deaminase [Hahella sp. HNIBRBA332]